MLLPARLQPILDVLLAKSEDSRRVTLDELADEIGTAAVTPPEIDALIEALEAAGRDVDTHTPSTASRDLRAVLASARQLGAELGRRPTPSEIAAHAGLTAEAVRHALAFARVLQR